MKKSVRKFSVIHSSVFLVLSVLSAILFRASCTNWVFINKTVGFEAFCEILLLLMVYCIILFAYITAEKLYSKDKNPIKFPKNKLCKTVVITGIILSTVLFIFAFSYATGLAISESGEVFFMYLNKTLKQCVLYITLPFFAVFFPKMQFKTKKIIIGVTLLLTLISSVNSFYPLKPFKITSEPMVIDNGIEYSIVFSTNDYSTAYAQYTYNGKAYKVFDNTDGRLNSDSKIHSVSVPYEHLRNNTYSVGATRVIEEFSYGSRTGKTVNSKEYKLTYNDTDNQKWLVISDWHTMLDTAYKSIEYLSEDYDAVILLGDASPGVDFEEQVITNTVRFGGKISEGSKPVLYVRGNHETRGAYAKKLPDALGLDKFYYTADIGDYTFIVLDSGEDKDDSHIEYGGMNDYNTYRSDMIDWLAEVEVENDKIIALSHSWKISDVEEELSLTGWAELDRLETRLLLSGHEHQCRFLGSKEGKENDLQALYPNITGYIDGGKSQDDYIASLLTMNKYGFNIRAVDNNGNEIVNENFEW